MHLDPAAILAHHAKVLQPGPRARDGEASLIMADMPTTKTPIQIFPLGPSAPRKRRAWPLDVGTPH
jgi:hypothetical protein